MKHTEWKQYMHETAERCRRQIAVELRARAHIGRSPTLTLYGPPCNLQNLPRVAVAPAMVAGDAYAALPGHQRPLDWFEAAVRRGCTDED